MLVTGSRFLTSDKSSRAAGTRMLTVLLEKGRADQDTHCVSGEGTRASADGAVCAVLRAVTDLHQELGRLVSTYQSLGS